MKIFYILCLIVLAGSPVKSQTRPIASAGQEIKLINVYPNPATVQITFNFEKRFDKNYSLQIFNFIGKKVHDLKTINPLTIIDLTGLYRGVYIFQVRDKAGKVVETGKFQVAR